MYLGLGSNIGDRAENLRQALELLETPRLHVTRTSSTYETAPIDYTAQASFLNLVAEAETELLPMQLLKHVMDVERQMGRKRLIPKGPRVIDVDILLYGNFKVNSPQLEIPHPRMTERRFVLEPLAELAPDLRHPVTRKSMKELLGGVMTQAARRL